jgi:ABC-type lipoprotein export system ATPase subunit
MVTHDPVAAARATRLLHLDKGKLVDDLTQDDDGRLARSRLEAAS